MPKTPILLLKTQSTPHDAYADFFTSQNYHPTFIPVLEHDFHAANLQTVQHLFDSGALGPPDPTRRRYGGLIFTSQRAVEGVARVLESVDCMSFLPLPPSLSLSLSEREERERKRNKSIEHDANT